MRRSFGVVLVAMLLACGCVGASQDPGTGAAANVEPSALIGAEGGSPSSEGESSLPTTAPGFTNLAPPMGSPLAEQGEGPRRPAPLGWTWYGVDGAVCRDGSPAGFFAHDGTADKLLVFLEGGGACSNKYYCDYNPASVDQTLAGDGQTVLGSVLGALPGGQRPGVYTQADHLGAPAGVFDFAISSNPFEDWSQIYIPYCTGDVFFGTARDGSVPGLSNQQFVGYSNMKLFMSRIVPTYKDRVSRVVLSGASAGAFGALLNFSMVQDSFGETPVDALIDSGPTFDDEHMPVCMQKRWRDSWGFEGSLPPDCDECRQADGGGLANVIDFTLRKHPRAHIALLSTMEDEVIRLFYSVGLKDCANYDSVSPASVTLLQADPEAFMPAETYREGLNALRAKHEGSERFSTFYIGGLNPNYHQHIFRPEFYLPSNGTTQARFVSDFLDGTVSQIGP